MCSGHDADTGLADSSSRSSGRPPAHLGLEVLPGGAVRHAPGLGTRGRDPPRRSRPARRRQGPATTALRRDRQLGGHRARPPAAGRRPPGWRPRPGRPGPRIGPDPLAGRGRRQRREVDGGGPGPAHRQGHGGPGRGRAGASALAEDAGVEPGHELGPADEAGQPGRAPAGCRYRRGGGRPTAVGDTTSMSRPSARRLRTVLERRGRPRRRERRVLAVDDDPGGVQGSGGGGRSRQLLQGGFHPVEGGLPRVVGQHVVPALGPQVRAGAPDASATRARYWASS